MNNIIRSKAAAKISVLVVIVLLMNAMCGCFNIFGTDIVGVIRGEWILDLPNDYKMWKTNAEGCPSLQAPNACFDAGSDAVTPVPFIGHEIIYFCYNDTFVCARCTGEAYDWRKAPALEDLTADAYYIVNTSTNETYGLYLTEEEFNAALDKLGITGLCNWIKGDERPRGAY